MKPAVIYFLIIFSTLFTKAQPPVPRENTGLVNAYVNEKGDLKISPSVKSADHDFDFFYGHWKVSGKTLKNRLQGSADWTSFTATLKCSKILQGAGNIEPFYIKRNGQDF